MDRRPQRDLEIGVQSLARLAVEEIVVVHHLAVDMPLSLKRAAAELPNGRRWLTCSIPVSIM